MAAISKIRGYILTSEAYRDADTMIKVLTDSHGLLTFIAKGARKLQSKNASSILPYMIADFYFTYKEGKDIFALQKAEAIAIHHSDDLPQMAALSLISKLTLEAYDTETYRLLYKELLETLENIKVDMMTAIALYLVKLSKLLGFAAYVDGCVVCDGKKVTAFSVTQGGLLCEKHRKDEVLQEVEALRRIRYINKMDSEHLKDLVAMGFGIDDLKLIKRFFYRHTGFDERAFDFFMQTIDIYKRPWYNMGV